MTNTPPTSPLPASQADSFARLQRLASGLTGGMARLLHRSLLLLQPDGEDLALALTALAAGAQVNAVAPVWSIDPGGVDQLTQTLRTALRAGQPRLNVQALNRGPDGQWKSLRLHSAARPESITLDPGVRFGPVILDGLESIGQDARKWLEFIFRNTPPGTQIEMHARPGAPTPDLRAIMDEAVKTGFGVRRPPNPEDSLQSVGLIRLSGPQQEFPVIGREGDHILAACQSRLDIASRLVAGCDVLDAGGGTAIGARRYLQAGARSVVNLDLSHEALEIGRSLGDVSGRIRFVPWDMNMAPFPLQSDSFDVIVCLEALEHTHAHESIIREFDRILRPGGVLLISVPDLQFERAAAAINRCENPHHRKVPSRAELAALLEGFEELHWFRQCDVISSMVLSESSGSNAEVMASPVCNPSRLMSMPEVTLVACRKARTIGLAPERQAQGVDRPIEKLLGGPAPLRVHSSAAETVIPVRLRADELENELLRQRHELWCRINEQRDHIEKLNERAAELRSSAAASRATIQRVAELEAALRQGPERIATAIAQLKAEFKTLPTMDDFRQAHDQFRAAATQAVGQEMQLQARSFSAAINRITTTVEKQSALQQSQLDHLRHELTQLAGRMRCEQQEILQETARLLLQTAQTFGSIAERAEERVMQMESRVYDLEEQLADAQSRAAVGGGQ